jgi:hypothetical protein
MRRGALLNLVARPLTILYVADVLAPAVMALAVMALDPGDSRAVGVVVRFSLYTCALSGVCLGGAITTAARCSFAWTLPRFRREVLREFVACGVPVSVASGLIATLTTSATMSGLLAGVMGFAVFSLGGAMSLIPEAPPLLLLGGGAFAFFATSTPGAVLNAPLAVAAIAVAIASTVALWFGLGNRTLRSSSDSGVRGNVPFVSNELHTLAWWPRRQPRRAGACPEDTSRLPYVGTSVFRGVVTSYQPVRPRRLLGDAGVGVLLVALIMASLVWLKLITVNPAAPSNLWFSFVLVGPMTALAVRTGLAVRSSLWPVGLPWSRRQQLLVAYVRDLIAMLGYLLAACLATLAVAFVIAHPDRQWIAGLARAGAATALLLPMFQGRDRGRLVLAILVVIPVAATVYGVSLPVLVISPAAQAIVLGVLFVASQSLHWLSLRRYFTSRDLVGLVT